MIQAVVLAGGLGTRLRPTTESIPKPMVPISGRPYLHYQIDYLRDQGVRRAVLLTGYLGEQIEEYFGTGEAFGVELAYSREESPLGTGGALRHARALFDDQFLLLYGDSFQPIRYQNLVQAFEVSGRQACVVAYNNQEDTDVKNNLEVSPDGIVLRYEKDVNDASLNRVEAGVLVLKKTVLSLIPEGASSLEQETFPLLVARGQLHAYTVTDRFYDIGTPERLAAAEYFFSTWPTKNT